MEWFAELAEWANANEGLLQGLAMLGGLAALLVSLVRRAPAPQRVESPISAVVVIESDDLDARDRVEQALLQWGGRREDGGRFAFDDAGDAARAALDAAQRLGEAERDALGVLVAESGDELSPFEDDRGQVVTTDRLRRALDPHEFRLSPRPGKVFGFEVARADVRRRRARWLLPAGGAALLLAGAVGIWSTRDTPSEVIRSIAVLPFENLNRDDDRDYVADGVTVTLIGELSRYEGLRVISRTSIMPFKGGVRSLQEIAAALDVDAVIEGSVLHAGDALRIDSHLIRIRDERTMWAESYERDFGDVLALQRDIARAVSEAVISNVRRTDSGESAGTTVADATTMQSYLRANQLFDQRTDTSIDRAIREYKRILGVHPSFTPAYQKLAEAYMMALAFGADPREFLIEARSVAERAIAIDPNLAEAYLLLGVVGAACSFDWTTGVREMRRALVLNPNSSFSHRYFGAVLTGLGHFDEALEHSKRAVELDPLSLSARAAHGIRLYQVRRFSEASKVFQALRAEHPSYQQATRWLGRTWIEMQRGEEGIELIRSAMEHGERRSDLAWIAHGLATLNRQGEALAIARGFSERPHTQRPSALQEARVWAALGDTEAVLREIDLARERCQSSNAIWGPAFDPYRENRRFAEQLDAFGYDEGVQSRWLELIRSSP